MTEQLRQQGFEEIDPSEIPGEDEGNFRSSPEQKQETDQGESATWQPVEAPPKESEEPGPADKLIRAFEQADQKDKDKVARTYKAAKKTGKDPAVVEVDLSRAEKAANRPDFEKMAGEAPTLTKANTSAFFQNQASDDTDNLTALEKIGQTFKQSSLSSALNMDARDMAAAMPFSWPSIPMSGVFGSAGNVVDWGKIAKQYQQSRVQQVELADVRWRERVSGATPETRKAIEQIKGQRKKPMSPDNVVEDFLLSASRLAPFSWETLKESQKYGLAGASAGAAAGAPTGLGAAATAATGYTIGTIYGAFKESYKIEGSLAYDEMIEQGIDKDIANNISIGVGALSGGLEVSQLSDVVRTIPGAKNAIRKGLMKAALSAAKRASTKKEIGKAAGRGAQFLTREVAQELVQESTQLAGQEWGKRLNNQLRGTDLEHITPEQAAQQMLAIAEESAKAFTVFGLPGGTMQTVNIARTAKQEAKTEQKLEQIAKIAGKSKLYQRNPDLFKDFVADLQQQYGHVPKKLYLDSGTVRQVFQDDPEIAETLGYDRDDLESKLADDEDVRIGFESAIDLYQRSDWDTIKEGLREEAFAPEDVDQATMQRITELFQSAEEITAPAQRFRDRIVDTVEDREAFKKQNGVTPEAFAQDQAKVIDAFAQVWAENTGRTPEQYWEYRGFDIEERDGRDSPFYGTNEVDVDTDVRTTYEISETRARYDEDQPAEGRAGGGVQDFELEYYTAEDPPSDETVQSIIKSGQVEQVTTGQFDVNVDTISSPEAAAAAVKPLATEAQEHAVALVVDADGKPVSVIKHSVGSDQTTQVFSGLFAAAVHNTPGAAQVYLAHNHPSGSVQHSQRDWDLAQQLDSQLADTGVELQGSIVITPTGRASFFSPRQSLDEAEAEITPAERANLQRQIEVKERRFTSIPENPFEIRGPDSLHSFMQQYLNDQQGVLLLNNANSPVGFVPMDVEEMQQLRLRETGKGASKLWQAVDRTNGTSMAVNFTEGDQGDIAEALDNMLHWGRENQVRTLDALNKGESLRKEGVLQSRQERLESRGTFFQEGVSDAITLFHGTSTENLRQIQGEGRLEPISGGIFFSPRKEAAHDFGEEVIQVDVSKQDLKVDVDLPGSRLLSVEEANAHTGNDSWSIEDYLDAGYSVGIEHAISVKPSLEQEQRGSVTLRDDGRAVINLFQGNDLSTILHETGHIFRRDLEEMANLPGVSQQVRDDWQTILDWVGAEDGNWTREQEEQFAQAWEEYFREGTAPVPKLKKAFHRFRKWLLDIYEGGRRSFKLNNDVRAVFDRMLATRDELDHAAEEMMLDPALEKEDVPDEDWEEYQRLAAEAKREAMERATKERIANWRKLQREWRKQAEEDADSHPIIQIRREIKKNGKLNINALRNDYDAETIKEIQRKAPGILSKDGELLPDSAAEQYGYEYDDFIRALMDTPTKSELEDQFFRQLEAEYDKQWRPDEALLSEEQFKVLDKEIEILNKKLERYNPPASRSLAKHIRQQVQKGRYQDIETDLDTLLGTLHREGKEAKRAIREARREGKQEAWETALEQKRRQRLQAIKLREQRKAKKRVETIRRKLRRWLKQKSLDPDYKEQLRQFLAPFDLAQRTDKALRERESLRQFIEEHREAGEQVLDIPPNIEELAGRKHPKEISLAELEEIHDTAQRIVHLGRLKSKLIAAQKERDFQEVKNALIETATTQHRVAAKPEGVPPPSARNQGAIDSMVEKGHGWMADLRKIEFILQSLDGTYGDEVQAGPWWENFFKPIKDAEHEQTEVLQEVMSQLDEAFKPLRDQGQNELTKKHPIEGFNHSKTREEMIMVALNWGNEGNRDAVRWGYDLMDAQLFQQNPEAARLQADTYVGNILNKLTEAEWQFVSDVWEIIDGLYPRINEAHKALTGQALDKVEPSPVDTPIGQLRGGYFPLVFDRELSYKADVYKSEQEAALLFETIYQRPKTESGHRVSRRGGKLPPYLDFTVITSHVQKAVHDATHAVPIRDVYKLIKDADVRQAVIDTQGKATYDQLMPWLQYVAKPGRSITTTTEKLLRGLRENTTIALLGANVGTMMAQPMSITQAVDAVGLRNMAPAFMSFWANPHSFVETVQKKSTQMADRRKNWNRELSAMSHRWIPSKNRKKRFMQQARMLAMYTISLGDYVGAFPSWMGAYKKAQSEGYTENEAVEYADRIVRTTQPAAAPKDLPTVQQLNKGEGIKYITMFYSFFNVFYNRMYNKHQGKIQGQVGAFDLARSYLWMVAVPPILIQVFKHRGDLDEEYWREQYLKDLIGYASGTIPLVRDAMNSLVTGFEYSLTPVSEGIGTGVEVADRIFSEDTEAGAVAETAFEAAGYALGLPTPAAMDMMNGLADVMSGRTDDYLRPLYGKKREDWRD